MTGPRGKRRKVVEVLSRERESSSEVTRHHGYYACTVRLECGHVVKAQAKDRYRKDAVPVVAFCRHPDCIMGKAVAA